MFQFSNQTVMTQNIHQGLEQPCTCRHPYEHGGKSPELAEAYVPFQEMDGLYPPEEGLCKGTVFPELYRPYSAKRGAMYGKR